jgi:signal transduction histidine kinase
MGSLTPPKFGKRQRLVATFGGAAIFIVVGAVVQAARIKAVEARRWVDHTYAVMQAAAATKLAIADAETGQRGYIITGDTTYLAPHDSALTTLRTHLAALNELTRDNPTQQSRLDTLRTLIDERIAEVSRNKELRRAQGLAAAAAGIQSNRGRALTEAIRASMSAIEADERGLLAAREADANRWRGIITITLLLGTLGSAAVVLMVNSVLSRFAANQEESARILSQQNAQLQEQGLELELQHQQLQDQATELELSNEQLQQQAVELEAQTEEAERAQLSAESANAAKTEFLAAMSHELRTPLNAIAGYADLLAMGVRGPVSDEQLEDVRRIKKSSLHLLSLINEILNLARIEAGHLDLRMSNVRVAPMLEDVVALVAPQMRSKDLQCSVGECDPALAVHTDAEKARQILLNLLTNAYKFTDRGGRVVVACNRLADAGDASMIAVRVVDTGRGIPDDKLSAIFEPFVQIDRRLTPEPEQGLGLGLAISRDLARAMGGDLTVASVVGQGSTFTLTLPASPVGADIAEPGVIGRRRIADAMS